MRVPNYFNLRLLPMLKKKLLVSDMNIIKESSVIKSTQLLYN